MLCVCVCVCVCVCFSGLFIYRPSRSILTLEESGFSLVWQILNSVEIKWTLRSFTHQHTAMCFVSTIRQTSYTKPSLELC
jgi:hypothetical protein